MTPSGTYPSLPVSYHATSFPHHRSEPGLSLHHILLFAVPESSSSELKSPNMLRCGMLGRFTGDLSHVSTQRLLQSSRNFPRVRSACQLSIFPQSIGRRTLLRVKLPNAARAYATSTAQGRKRRTAAKKVGSRATKEAGATRKRATASKTKKTTTRAKKPVKSKSQPRKPGPRPKTEKQKDAAKAKKARTDLQELRDVALVEPKSGAHTAWGVLFAEQGVKNKGKERGSSAKAAAAIFKTFTQDELEVTVCMVAVINPSLSCISSTTPVSPMSTRQLARSYTDLGSDDILQSKFAWPMALVPLCDGG